MFDLLPPLDAVNVVEGIIGGVVASFIVLVADRAIFEARRTIRGLRRSRWTWGELWDRIRGRERLRCPECGAPEANYVDEFAFPTERDDAGNPLKLVRVVEYRCGICGEEWREESEPYDSLWKKSRDSADDG